MTQWCFNEQSDAQFPAHFFTFYWEEIMKIIRVLFSLIVLAMPFAHCEPSSHSSIKIIINSNTKNKNDEQKNTPPATNENRTSESQQRNTPPSRSPSNQNPEPQDNENWNIALLDTARTVDYLSEIEKDVILEMNKARSNPKKYAEHYLVPFAKRFRSNGTYMKGNITMMTNEGVDAVNECIKEMSMKRAVEILKPAKGLSLAAQSHATSQAKTGQLGHNGTDGSTPFTRIKKHGTYRTAGENIAYGSKSGQEIVINLLVDDGVKNRGHRKNILNPEFTQTGVGYAEGHKTYEAECVITYAGGYEERK